MQYDIVEGFCRDCGKWTEVDASDHVCSRCFSVYVDAMAAEDAADEYEDYYEDLCW